MHEGALRCKPLEEKFPDGLPLRAA